MISILLITLIILIVPLTFGKVGVCNLGALSPLNKIMILIRVISNMVLTVVLTRVRTVVILIVLPMIVTVVMTLGGTMVITYAC